VDVFANAVTTIAATTRALGTTVYHVTSPQPATIGLVGERLRAAGYLVKTVPYQDWLNDVAALLAGRPEHPMAAFQPLFVERCRNADMPIADMYLESVFPPFGRDNTEQALTGSGVAVPPVSDSMTDRYLAWLASVGFLPSIRRSGMSQT
jgi:hypothetical protein